MKEKLQSIIKKHPRFYELFKFGVAGAFTTVIDMASMALVIFLFDPHAYTDVVKLIFSAHSASAAAVVTGTSSGFLLSLAASYFLSIHFVFTASRTEFARSGRGFIIYSLISLTGFLMHAGGMYIGYEILGVNEWIVKIILTLTVMLFSYVSRKMFIFKNTQQNELKCKGLTNGEVQQ